MTPTMEEMATRLERVEHEISRLRRLVEPAACGDTPAERGAQLLRAAASNQSAIQAAAAKAFAEMGITVEPIGSENVQKLMQARREATDDPSFSRGIIEVREE